MPVNDRIQIRKGTLSEWVASNPVLASGEPGYDITNNLIKIGDGVNPWTDLPLSATSDVYVYAKNTTTGTLYKGQAVYINGAIGNNPTLELAIATGDATSSKTIGLLKQNLAINEFGYVIAEGILDQVNTNGASSAGDPIWLSPTTPGGLLYGTANKPYAPNHLVFLGYVLRKQLNTGKIYVKIQNGYELEELHNVAVTGATNGQFLQYNSVSGLWLASSSGNFTTLQLNGNTVSVTGHTHTSNNITDFNEAVDDRIGSLLVAGTGINLSYNDNSNLLTVNLASAAITGYEILTEPKSVFTVSQGYLANNLNVYYNGFKLLDTEDYTATNGSTFTLYGTTASGDIVEWQGVTALGQYSPVGHTHSSSEITNFNSSVSGLLPITNISGGNNIGITINGTTYTVSVTGQLGLTGEEVDDRVAGLLVSSTGIYINYNDSSNILTIASTGYANATHTHSSSSITDFNSSVSGLVSGIYAPLSGKLNQFAMTSSSELSSIISDETGNGLLVFNNSPTFTGIPIVPTAGSGTNTNQIASTAFVRTEISNLVASAPSTLDTLNELAIALGNDANFSTTVTNSLAGKANLSGAIFTGSISSPSGNFTESLRINGTGVSISGHTHIASDIGDSTVVGRALLTAADAAAQRTSLGLGSIATLSSGTYALSSHTHTSSDIINFNSSVSGLINGIYAPLSGKLSQFASTSSSELSSIISDETGSGSLVFNDSPTITGLLTSQSGNFTSSLKVNSIDVSVSGHTHTASSISDSTTAGRALLTAADASSQRISLGLGSLATQNGTFSGTSSGTNTGDQTISIVGDVAAAGSTGALTATVTKINGVALSGLSTGLLKNTTGTGAPSIAIAGTDYAAASHNHTVSNITDFNSSVSGLLPVTSIVAGSGISVSSLSGTYTINAKVYSTTIGDGSTTSYTVTHNLSVSNDVQVTVRDTGTNYYVYPDIKYVNSNSVLIEFTSAPTSNQYRVSIIGF